MGQVRGHGHEGAVSGEPGYNSAEHRNIIGLMDLEDGVGLSIALYLGSSLNPGMARVL